jgi:hypothetical protein
MAIEWMISDLDAFVAHMAEVKGVIRGVTEERAAVAKARKAATPIKPSNKGPHSYVDTGYNSTDGFINLNDPGGAAGAIEKNKRYITGDL